MRLGLNHADVGRSSLEVWNVKEKFTVFMNFEDLGSQQLANWAEKEVVVEGKEKNAGYVSAAFGTVITNEVQDCRCVTLEAESAAEALKAARQFFAGGVTNPGKSAPAVTVGGLGGGPWANSKGLACKTSSLTEEQVYP